MPNHLNTLASQDKQHLLGSYTDNSWNYTSNQGFNINMHFFSLWFRLTGFAVNPSVNNCILCFIHWKYQSWFTEGLSTSPLPHLPPPDSPLAWGEWAKGFEGKKSTEHQPHMKTPGKPTPFSKCWLQWKPHRAAVWFLWESKVIFQCLQHWFWSHSVSKLKPEGVRSWCFYPNSLGQIYLLWQLSWAWISYCFFTTPAQQTSHEH